MNGYVRTPLHTKFWTVTPQRIVFLLEANENLYANIINLTQGQGKVAATIPSARQMLAFLRML